MGSSQTTQQSQTKNPWDPAVGNLKGILDTTQNLANDSSVWTPTQSGATQTGLGQLGQLGQQQSFGAGTVRGAVGQTQQGLGTAINGLQQTANGAGLNGNPYMQNAVHNSMQDASDMVQSQFSGAGRLGSAADTKVLTDRLGNISNNAYMNNYNQERGYQNQAQNTLGGMGLQGAGMAGSADQMDARQAGYGLAAGGQQDQFDQAKRMAPVTANSYNSGITNQIAQQGGSSNGTTTTSQNPSTGAMLGGAAMTGLGMMAGMPPGMMGGMGGLLGLNPGMGSF